MFIKKKSEAVDGSMGWITTLRVEQVCLDIIKLMLVNLKKNKLLTACITYDTKSNNIL